MKKFSVILSSSFLYPNGRIHAEWEPEDQYIKTNCIGKSGFDFDILSSLELTISEFEPKAAKHIFQIFNDYGFNADGSWELDPKYLT